MSRFDELMQQGLAAVESGEFEAARRIYEQCIAINPAHMGVRIRYADTFYSQKKYLQAIEIGQQIIAADADYHQAYSLLGICYHELGQLDEAERSFRRAIALRPHHFDLIFLHSVLLDVGQREEALTCLQDALQLDPNYDETHYNLGCCYKLAGGDELAEHHLRQAINLDPQYAIAYAELGHVLYHRALKRQRELAHAGELYKEAKHMLLKSIELKPNYGWARIYLGNLLWYLDKPKAAEEQFRAALEIWPEDSLTHWIYGDFLSATHRDQAKAGQLLRRAVELDPQDDAAYFFWGKHLLRCKHKFKAKQALAKAAELGHKKAAKLLAELERQKSPADS